MCFVSVIVFVLFVVILCVVLVLLCVVGCCVVLCSRVVMFLCGLCLVCIGVLVSVVVWVVLCFVVF